MLSLVFDENFDHRILRGLESQLPDLDFIVVQYTEFRGAGDPQLLARAAEQNRILITHDLKTIPKFVYERVAAKLPTPGVIAVPDWMPIGQTIEELAILVACSEPNEFVDLVRYLPL
jgi:hypothetical protein